MKGLFAGLVFAGFALLVVAPPVLLLLGLHALRRERPRRTEDLATICVVASWFLLPFTVLMAVRFHTEMSGTLGPAVWLLPLYPLAIWLAAWRLSRAARRRLEEAAADERRPAGHGGDPAAPR